MEPIELLKTELNNDNVSVKVNAIHRLPLIIYAYKNPNSKKKEIIKFLKSYVLYQSIKQKSRGRCPRLSHCF